MVIKKAALLEGSIGWPNSNKKSDPVFGGAAFKGKLSLESAQ
jgi:hypothetical protein